MPPSDDILQFAEPGTVALVRGCCRVLLDHEPGYLCRASELIEYCAHHMISTAPAEQSLAEFNKPRTRKNNQTPAE